MNYHKLVKTGLLNNETVKNSLSDLPLYFNPTAFNKLIHR